MTSRGQPNRGAGGGGGGGSGSGGDGVRQNEYFVPRDGIDREVITADICRYLGNDALVRPGNYNNESTGRNIQGYYIKAYRNLTTAMIADLKADSSRWEQERRKLQSGAGRYADSAVRQMSGNYSTQSRDYQNRNPDYGDGGVTYPGSDAPGYSGSGTPAAAAPYPQGSGTYGPAPTPYPGQAYPSYVTHQPAGDLRYPANPGTGPAMPAYTTTEPPWTSGGPYAIQPQHSAQPSRQDYPMADTAMTDVPQPMPASRPPPYNTGPRPGYPAPATAPYGYTTTTTPSYQPSTVTGAPYQHPQDNFYGRSGYSGTTSTTQAFSDPVVSPAVTTGYSPAPPDSYDDPMTTTAHPTAAASGTTAQMAPVAQPSRRDRDRGGERDRESHERQRDRDRDRDRGDRDRDRDHRQERGDEGQRRKAHHYGRS